MYFFDDIAWETRALGELDRRRNVQRQVMATVQPDTIANLIEQSRTWPSLPTGVLTGAALAGVQPDSDVMHTLAQQVVDREQEGFNFLKAAGGFLHGAGSALKGTVRLAATSFETLWEEVIARPTRTAVGVYQGMGLGEAYEMAGESAGLRALKQWAENPLAHSLDWVLPGEQVAPQERINLGSGFFQSSDFITQEAALENPLVQEYLAQGHGLADAAALAQGELGRPLTVEAREDAERIQISKGGTSVPVSPGRLLAITVTEPGTQPFNLLSGFADAAAQIYLDPADKLLKGLRLANLASNTLIPDGARRTVRNYPSPTISEFLSSPLMRDAAEWTATQGPDQFAAVRHVWGRKLAPSRGSAQFVKALTDERNPDRIIELVRSGIESGLYQRAPLPLALGPGVRRGFTSSRVGQKIAARVGDPSVGFYGGIRVGLTHRLEGTAVGRLFSQMGGSALPIGNVSESVDEFEKFLSSAGFGADEASRYLYRMASVPEGEYEGALKVVSDAVNDFGSQLAAEGIPEPIVRRMTQLYDSNESLRQYFIAQNGNPAWFPGAAWYITDDGIKRPLPQAQLISEFVNQAIPLPDPRRVRSALHQARSRSMLGVARMARDWDDLGPGALTKIADFYIGKVWKPLTLLRVAWPVRVIGEEQVRMLGANLDSVFNHPLQYVGWMMSSRGRLARKYPNLIGATARGEVSLLGADLTEALEYQRAMSTVASFGLDPARAPGPTEFIKIRAGEAGYHMGWHRELHQLVNDPVASEVIGAWVNDIDNAMRLGDDASDVQWVKNRFWDGDLSQHRRRLISDSGRWDLLHNRRWADGYVDSLLARIHYKTGGDFYYFDESGNWFDSASNALDPSLIPPGDAAFSNPAARSLRQFSTAVRADSPDVMARLDDFISQLTDMNIPQGFMDDLRTIREDLIPSGGNFRPEHMRDIGQWVSDAVDSGWLPEEFFTAIQKQAPSVSPGGRELIPGNELEDLRSMSRLGRAESGGRHLLAEGLESIGPVNKLQPQDLQSGVPDGDAFFLPNGADMAHPSKIVVAHDGVIHAQLRLDWSGDRLLEAHIATSQMHPGDLNKMFNKLMELDIDPMDLHRMLFSGTSIRDWLLSSPTLRNMSRNEFDSLPAGELLRRIAGVADEMEPYGVDEVLEAFDDPAGLWVVDPDDLQFRGSNRNRVGWMWNGALQQEAGDSWARFKELLVEGDLPPLPHPAQFRALPEWLDQVDEAGGGAMIDFVANRLGERTPAYMEGLVDDARLAAADIVSHAAEAELSVLLAQATDESMEAIARALDIDARTLARMRAGRDWEDLRTMGQLPMAPPPGGYPISYQGGRSFSAATGRWLQPKTLQELPQHRPQYHIARNGNEQLLRELAAGKLGEVDLRNITRKAEVQRAADHLRTYDATRPAVVKGSHAPDRQTMSDWDQMVSTMFSTLMSKPTNQLSRSPAFRQFYWKRVAHMYAWADETVKAEILRLAKDAGIEESFLRNEVRNTLRSVLGRDKIGRTEAALNELAEIPVAGIATGTPSLIEQSDLGTELERIDDIAKAFALEETQRLLYDITRKHDVADMMRNIFPFAEAWGEIMTSWLRIMTNNPRMFRRLQQSIEGARGSGFFYDDPATGEEVFNYPGSGLIAKWMLGGDPTAFGASVPQFTGRVQGLNLIAGGYLPGFGPIVQIPASTMFEEYFNNPANRWVRDLVLPFGESELETPGGILDLALPAWFRRAMTAIGRGGGDNERLYANTVMDVYRALVQGGTGTDATPEDAAITLDRAKNIARNLYLVRAIAQFAAPTGPAVRFDIRDRDGQIWTYASLGSEYRRIQEENEFDDIASFNQFTDLFGLDPTLFSTAKTRSVVRRSTTEAGRQWEAENPDLFERNAYFLTAYYAKPDDPYAEFDYTAYRNQLEAGTRQPLTPDQWVRVRNDYLGRLAYEHARRMVMGRTDDVARGWLRQTRFQLMERYPGYNEPAVGLAERADRESIIRELYRWQDEPRLAETEAGQGVIRYLQKRDQALAIAAQMGISEGGFSSAVRTEYLRRWLTDVGRYFSTMYPDFGPIYDQVLRREVEDEENQPVELLGATYGS